MKPNIDEAKRRLDKETKVIYDAYSLTLEQKDFGLNKTYFIKTYGCQMNEHDSEKVKAMLEDMSFQSVDSYEQADLVILNTCAIRENVHDKVFGMLGRLKHLKQSKPGLMVGLCGCMAQEEGVVETLTTKYPWVNFIFGTHNLHQLPKLLTESFNSSTQQVEVWSTEGDIVEYLPIKRANEYKAWVNIMYGCDKFCTYCIVPMTRGKQRSRLIKDIVDEVNSLIKAGYREVTLLGQNVNAYGKDLNDSTNMADLLEAVAKTGVPRIRFVTSHPWDFETSMIDIISKYSNIMPYIHLPVQSGSNRILRLMRRKYTKEEYLKLFKEIKNKIPRVTITTDIIVGFPGETEEDFQETLNLYHECQFDLAYTFIYSPREGTAATKLTDDVAIDTKEQRLQKLNEVVNKYALSSNKNYLNQEVMVLLDGVSHKDKSVLSGYTDTMKLVNVKAPIASLGEIVKVKITDAKSWSLTGELNE